MLASDSGQPYAGEWTKCVTKPHQVAVLARQVNVSYIDVLFSVGSSATLLFNMIIIDAVISCLTGIVSTLNWALIIAFIRLHSVYPFNHHFKCIVPFERMWLGAALTLLAIASGWFNPPPNYQRRTKFDSTIFKQHRMSVFRAYLFERSVHSMQ